MKGQLLKINDPLPQFKNLPNVDGTSLSSNSVKAEILVVVFSCNHCPYVQAYEDRMMDFQKEYGAKGVQMVAINSNDTKNYPDDDFKTMVQRSAARGFNFPYLRDEDQAVADAFGATHTPQFFVFDKSRKLRYSGKMDDNWKEPQSVKEKYLREAVDALIAGKPVKTPETFSIGCTIKWK
ncbi:MAG TPA: thioredoxin family protein [Bacteroidota bacterium]|nr:thioredoxin family protein [Bacteroidota bacterium]